jgi:hypothetical protein
MTAASEWLRPTGVPPTATTAEPRNGDFCLLAPLSYDQGKAAVTASPPRDSFYDGMPDIERVFAVDYALLHRRHLDDTRYWMGFCTMQIVLNTITFALSELYFSAVISALLMVYFTYLLLNSLVVHRSMWLDMAGRHVALTTSGTIRYDRANAVPVPTTDYVRFFCFFAVDVRLGLGCLCCVAPRVCGGQELCCVAASFQWLWWIKILINRPNFFVSSLNKFNK